MDTIDGYIYKVKQVAALLDYGDLQILELFKNTLPSRLYYLLYHIDNLNVTIETVKWILTKEKIDKQKTGQSSATPFMKASHDKSKRSEKGVSFGAIETKDTIDKHSSSIDKLTSLESQHRPVVYQNRNRGRPQRQSNYEYRNRSYSQDRNQAYRGRGNCQYNNRGYRSNYRNRSGSRNYRYRNNYQGSNNAQNYGRNNYRQKCGNQGYRNRDRSVSQDFSRSRQRYRSNSRDNYRNRSYSRRQSRNRGSRNRDISSSREEGQGSRTESRDRNRSRERESRSTTRSRSTSHVSTNRDRPRCYRFSEYDHSARECPNTLIDEESGLDSEDIDDSSWQMLSQVEISPFQDFDTQILSL